MKKILSLVLMVLIVFPTLSILQTNPAMAAVDEYFIYSRFDPPSIGDVVGVGGYVEYYGVPEWGDEIQYVYFLSGTTGYKVKVTVTDGDGDGKIEPRQHPSHYLSEFQGPIEPRSFEIVSSANLAGYTSGSGGHTEEFYVDSGGVYLGAYANGIHKWNHDWNFLEKVANRPPTRTESMAYNAADNVWYAGGRYRTIYELRDSDDDGSFLDENWVAIFTYPSYGGSHHDGMEYIGGYLWISDMTSDVIGKWEYDTATSTWNELKRFTYTEPASVEGMGFGPNDHFWCGSGWGSGSYVYELGNEITKGYPLADAGDDVDAHPPTIPVEFDASGSHHTDPAKEIVLYEWDFESDGTWDYSGTDVMCEHAYPAYYYDVPYFSQRDPAWASELLGGDGPTISSAGCALTSATMVMAYYGVDTDPKRLNDLIGRSGYDANYYIYWSVVAEKCHTDQNQIEYEGRIEPYSSEEVSRQLDAGHPVIVEVPGHFVVVTSRDGDTYYINDPWDQDIKTLDHYPTRLGLRIFSGVLRGIDWDKTAKDYTATLRVTDNSDPVLQDTDTCIVHITAPPWKPVADPDGPYEGYEKVSVQLDGSSSYDPESQMFSTDHPWYEIIAAYEWDLDNDGQFDDATGDKPLYTWDSKGLYIIGLRVTDSQPSGPGGTIGPLDVDITYTTVVIEETRAVNVAVVLAKPSDTIPNYPDKSRYEEFGSEVIDYYDEVSYGGIHIASIDIYDNFGDWYTLDGELWRTLGIPKLGSDDYGTNDFYGKERFHKEFTIPIVDKKVELLLDYTVLFALEVVLASDGEIQFSHYDTIIVVHPGESDRSVQNPDLMTTAFFGGHPFGVPPFPVVTPDDPDPDIVSNLIVVPETLSTRTWAHELGHALGMILVGETLPDRYKDPKPIDGYDLMARSSKRVHLSSYSKEFLGWLSYRSITFGTYNVESLVTSRLHDNIFVYYIDPIFKTSYYIVEVRTRDSSFSTWDTDVSATEHAIVYKVTHIPVLNIDTVSYYGKTRKGTAPVRDINNNIEFEVLEKTVSSSPRSFKLKVRVDETKPTGMVGAVLRGLLDLLRIARMVFPSPPEYNVPMPDLDLHAYTEDGSHVGVNYETGEYEVNIAGAVGSGDLGNDEEWIFVPENTKVHFLVSAKDNEEFLNAFPVALDYTDGTDSYDLTVVYYDQNGIRYESFPTSQQIMPGEERIHRCAIIQNPDETYTPVIDDTPPLLTVEVPQESAALQDGVTLSASAWDEYGVSSVTFSIREPNGEQGTPVSPDFEYMPASPSSDDMWELYFDTTQLPDGYYVAYVEAKDIAGNRAHNTTSFSIRNWATLELLPATESNKAGRTMPVKFSLRVVEAVDPDQPFVYNEELTIKIYEQSHPETILQESTYGDTARDYRINSDDELYITNFKTIRKKPKTYVVEIWRKDLLIGSFEFSTVK